MEIQNNINEIKEINDNKVHFPSNKTPRPEQVEALDFAVSAINDGCKFIEMNLPTGVGKSYFSVMFMNWYRNNINEKAKFDIITNSKMLQDQYISDFPFIASFKGKTNYYCEPHDTDCASGKEICKVIGPNCMENCPYEKAKIGWLGSGVGTTNFQMFNTATLYAKHIIEQRESNVLIIDEAHEFEEVFTGFISVILSYKQFKKYGFTLKEINSFDRNLKKVSDIYKLMEYCEKLKETVKDKLEEYTKLIEFKRSNKKLVQEYSIIVDECSSCFNKIDFMLSDFKEDENNWTMDITMIEKSKKEKEKEEDNDYTGIRIEAKPAWGHKYMRDIIYPTYDHVVFMSATMDYNIFTYTNGIDTSSVAYHSIPSPFPVKNRPIYYMPVGKMSYTNKNETLPEMVEMIKRLLNKYKNVKGIIHTHSYEVASYIQQNLIDKRLLFHDSENKEDILDIHFKSRYPSVIVSPVMVSGVDFKDDHARFQVICKIPYPFLGSKNVLKRKEDMPDWFTMQTINSLIQIYGRPVRSVNDYADTIILDSDFGNLMMYSGQFFPLWFSEAVKILKK